MIEPRLRSTLDQVSAGIADAMYGEVSTPDDASEMAEFLCVSAAEALYEAQPLDTELSPEDCTVCVQFVCVALAKEMYGQHAPTRWDAGK